MGKDGDRGSGLTPKAREEYEPLLRQWCACVLKDGHDSPPAQQAAQALGEPWKRLTNQEQSEMRMLSYQLLKQWKGGGG